MKLFFLILFESLLSDYCLIQNNNVNCVLVFLNQTLCMTFLYNSPFYFVSNKNASWCSKSGKIVVPYVFTLHLKVLPSFKGHSFKMQLEYFCEDTLVSCYVSHSAINVFWSILQPNKPEGRCMEYVSKQDEAKRVEK